jgi:hypothetical protein
MLPLQLASRLLSSPGFDRFEREGPCLALILALPSSGLGLIIKVSTQGSGSASYGRPNSGRPTRDGSDGRTTSGAYRSTTQHSLLGCAHAGTSGKHEHQDQNCHNLIYLFQAIHDQSPPR